MPRTPRRRPPLLAAVAILVATPLSPHPGNLGAQIPVRTAEHAAPPAGHAGQPASAEVVLEQYIAGLARARTVEAVRERTQFGLPATVYRVEDRTTRRYYQRVDGPDGVVESGYDAARLWQTRAAFQGYLSADDLSAVYSRMLGVSVPGMYAASVDKV